MKTDLLKTENQTNQKMNSLEDYGMFVTPEENAFWAEMDAERERFSEAYAKAQEELERKQSEGCIAMIIIDRVTGLPIVTSYKPKPKEADRGTKIFFWMAMLALGIVIMGYAIYFLF